MPSCDLLRGDRARNRIIDYQKAMTPAHSSRGSTSGGIATPPDCRAESAEAVQNEQWQSCIVSGVIPAAAGHLPMGYRGSAVVEQSHPQRRRSDSSPHGPAVVSQHPRLYSIASSSEA